ncbi:phosphopantetheine-binding protein, partial [Streptomyces sp. BF23-19]|uniref:phosphopantetheine-binding protein n=1 Tax=Streptomyces sp. BF23-19 TaxID=3240283 RepID=UPI0034E5C64D
RPDREAIAELLAEAVAAEAAQPADGADAQPASDAERTVAAAWEQVLGRTVGASENFFDVGGNSLLLIRLRDRLRSALDREVDVVDLFRHSTVKAMATFLGGAPATDAPSAAGERGQSRAQARAEAMRARGRVRQTSTPIPRKR